MDFCFIKLDELMKKSGNRPKHLRYMSVIIGVIIAIVLLSSCGTRSKSFQAPVFSNIGDYRMNVTYSSEDAKMFFDQGVLFTYGFNHGEAARSFREAIRLDSSFTMAYWGLAYTLGPNYNASMEVSDVAEVKWAVRKALKLKAAVDGWQLGLIDALEAKYPENSQQVDVVSFAVKMKEVFERFPANPDVATLYAESLMLLHPWDLYDYKGGPAKEWTPQIVSILENTLSLDKEHPLANHLYIHATEASSEPGLALEASKELSEVIVPGAGHLVHMPSHTYINTGDYHLGTMVNLEAVKADSLYSVQCEAQGAFPLYYYHNYHFLAACAALEGRGALAIESSFLMTYAIDKTLLAEPGFETTQHFMTIPYNVLVKFAQWEKILALQEPDVRYPYIAAMWHYSRGVAYANLNQLANARMELQKLNEIQRTSHFSELLIFGINSAQEVVEIALNVLGSEIALKSNDYEKAERLLSKAIGIEDAMSYNEPPDWFFSVRHHLGDLYMIMGRFADAENIYREDLVNFPKNGFALNGLYQSLLSQNNADEAERVYQMFESAWEYSDTILKYSRIDAEKRKNLVLKVKEKSPQEVIRLATAFCGSYQ